MAKVTSPLLSFSARGKLADTLVYFPWKGINAVRKYVIPADTPSAAKDTQRARITAALTEYHAALYTARDMTAWQTLAGIGPKIMSGFNRMVQEHVLQSILGSVWTRIHGVIVSAIVTTGFKVAVTKVSAGLVPSIYWGLSKTSMLNTHVMVDDTGNSWSYTIPDLTANNMYYFTIKVGVSGATFGRVGIYSQRTAAA